MSESPHRIIVYLDDNHKMCNQKFADMLGSRSPNEWSEMKTPVTDSSEDTRDNLISAVMGALQERTALYVQVAWKRIGGGMVYTTASPCLVSPRDNLT
jgi:hypothetical protein